jgi:uncharacterized protein (TIGR02145 family)
MKKYLLSIIILYLTLQIKAQTVSDVDGNTYNTVTIGSQIWMKENLKTTKYNDGSIIPNVTDSLNWYAQTIPAYCWYNNNATVYKDTYGALYNWYVVNTGKLCPVGWRVPAIADYDILINYLGGESVAGNKIKESGTAHWLNSTSATNSSGFTGLPGGMVGDNQITSYFSGIGHFLKLWLATENNSISAIYWGIDDLSIDSRDLGVNKKSGFSVRCIKDDNTSSINIFWNSDAIYFYPNPANDRLFLKNIKSSNATIAIFDLQGNPIGNNKIVSNFVDISDISKGIYFVKIVDSGNIVINKLIKE